MGVSSLFWTLGDRWQCGSQGLPGTVTQTSSWCIFKLNLEPLSHLPLNCINSQLSINTLLLLSYK